MSAKPWLPIEQLTYGQLANDSRVWFWKKLASSDASVVVLIVDDRYEDVINGSTPVAIGSDAYAVRTAVEVLIASHHVAEVLIGGFEKAVKAAVQDSRRAGIERKCLCVLLDILGLTRTSGVDFAKLLNDWSLPSINLAQFTKEGSADVKELGYPTVIPKPDNAAITEMYDPMKASIEKWIVKCASPLLSPYKKNVGHDILSALGDVLSDRFHVAFPDCHDVERCQRNNTVCRQRLASIDTSATRLAYREVLANEGLLSEDVRAKLFHPLNNPHDFESGIPCALSKTLSDYGPKRGRCVPGWWLAQVFGLKDAEVGLCQFEIPNSDLQPMSGFLHACHSLRTLPYSSADVITEKGQVCIEVTIKSDEAQKGAKGLEQLRSTLAAIFNNSDRPSAGDTTRIFQALADGGIQIKGMELASNQLRLSLTIPLIRVR